ncbi:MAG TPA: hypothetical protein VGR20_03630 [Acidimicrobiia bacterium]|nr:hypothetical protein [Acidimicrobiia bacterium]
MARPRWAAFAVLATITMAACTGGGKAKTTADGQVEDTSAAASSTKAAKSFDDLSKALAIAVPDGYVLQPDQVDDTGPSDLDKAVNDDGEADARDVFTRDHFVRGYQRLWSKSEDDEIIAYVYQFADHAGAVEYTKRLTADSGAQTDGVSIGLFTVPALEGAVGVNGSDPNFATSSVTFVKGPYSIQLVVNGASPNGLQSMATALAEEQASRL